MSELKWAENKMPKSDDKNLPIMSIEEVKKAKAFHKSFPQYTQTPLSELKEIYDNFNGYIRIGFYIIFFFVFFYFFNWILYFILN